ncbi:hypothetical protein DB346_15180 [Verrucomicrobia bacterium LW23]|nr:hypothetical protein DB346_15180 [Verrucomicrobia bacterium LW23]
MNTEYRPRQGGSRRGGRRHRRQGQGHGGDYNPQDSQAQRHSGSQGSNSHYVDDRDYAKSKKKNTSLFSRFFGWIKSLAGFKAPAAANVTAKGNKETKAFSNGNTFTKEKVRADRVEREGRSRGGDHGGSSDEQQQQRSERGPRRGGRNQQRPPEESDFTPDSSRRSGSSSDTYSPSSYETAEAEAPGEVAAESATTTASSAAESDSREPAPSPSKQQRLEITNPKLFVGNLSYDAAESDIYDLFSKVGKVKNVEVVKDRNNKSKGFAFVEMEHLESAKAAAAEIDQTSFMGRNIRISGAKSERQ